MFVNVFTTDAACALTRRRQASVVFAAALITKATFTIHCPVLVREELYVT